MFTVERPDVERVLRDYGIPETLRDFSELQRYHYERYDPDSREVRLILRLTLEGSAPLVLRFKNEEDVTQALLESQCRFAQTLRENGIPTPRQYRAEGCFTRWYRIGGYEVLAALEDFAEGQITVTDAAAAEQTGALLDLFDFKKLIFFVLAFAAIKKFKLHPIVYIACAAVIGIVLAF